MDQVVTPLLGGEPVPRRPRWAPRAGRATWHCRGGRLHLHGSPHALRSERGSVGNVPVSFLTLIIPLAQPSVSDGPIKVDLVHEKSKRRASLGWSVRRLGGRLAATPPSPARPPASSGLAGGAVTRGGAAHVTRREVHLLNFTGGRGPARQAPPLPRAGWRLHYFSAM